MHACARMVARFLVAICLFYENFLSGANPVWQKPESTTDCHWDSRCLYAISECSRLDGVRKFFLGSVFWEGESLSGVAAQVQ